MSSGFAKLVTGVSRVASAMLLLAGTAVAYVSFPGADNQASVCQGCKPGPQVAAGYDNIASAPRSEVMSRQVIAVALVRDLAGINPRTAPAEDTSCADVGNCADPNSPESKRAIKDMQDCEKNGYVQGGKSALLGMAGGLQGMAAGGAGGFAVGCGSAIYHHHHKG